MRSINQQADELNLLLEAIEHEYDIIGPSDINITYSCIKYRTK